MGEDTRRHRVDEEVLWRRLVERRDQAAREELVKIHLPMARRLAARWAGVSEPFDDLQQVASLGLLNAIDRFDPSRGIPFVGYAKPTILGELKRHFRDRVWTVRVPRSLHDRMVAVEKAQDSLAGELGRAPTVAELATHLELELEEATEILVAQVNRRPVSLDAPAPGEEGDDNGAAEWVGAADPGYVLAEDRAAMARIMPSLGPRERELLHMRFVEELPQSQIAVRMSCSQMQVSRLLRRTLDRLRDAAEDDPDGSPGEDRAAA